MRNLAVQIGMRENLVQYLMEYAKGKANCIKSSDLQDIFGGTSVDIRAVVNELRSEGKLICSCYDGYYYPESKEEVKQTISSLEGRVFGITRAITGMKGALVEDRNSYLPDAIDYLNS